jgi:hypothetical protein
MSKREDKQPGLINNREDEQPGLINNDKTTNTHINDA